MSPTSLAQHDSQTKYDQIILDIKDYVIGHKTQSSRAVQFARAAVLDALGCAIESLHNSPECRSMLGPYVPGTIVPDGFRLPGTIYRLDPAKGAFDLGTMIRYLDHNDALGGAEAGHPSDNLGAILAVSDWLCRAYKSGQIEHCGPPLTVKTLLEAMIKAYEIQGCFQLQNQFNAVGLDHTILVKLASTAVVSWLLGLDEDQILAAISHVWMDNSPLRVYRATPNTVSRKGWAAGDACMRAVQLGLLVRCGQRGAPSVLTTSRLGFYDAMWHGKEFQLPKAYGSWVMENIFFKVVPAEGHGISAMEAVLQQSAMLRARGRDPIRDIKCVKVRTMSAAVRIISKTGKLHNAADRDHCIQYMLAVVLLKNSTIEVADYQDESPWATDARVDALRAQMEILEDEQFTKDYLDVEKKSAASAVAIIFNDGSELDEVVVEYPVGHVENRQTLTAVRDKFRNNMGRVYNESEIDDMIRATAQDDMPVSLFVDLFVPKNAGKHRL